MATVEAGSRSSSEFQLKNGPSDGISRVRFAPNSPQFLLSSSWDSSLRLYDVQANTMRVKFLSGGPLLDCAFQDPIHVWSGGLEGQLRSADINSSTESIVGTHESAIRSGAIHSFIVQSHPIEAWNVVSF